MVWVGRGYELEGQREERATSMNEATEFIIGTAVACTDGVCGDLRRVVVDPVASAITHLVVEPRHRHDAGHLVPVDLVTTTAEQIQLLCTKSEFEALEKAEETQFLPGPTGSWGYDQGQMLSLPYFPLGGLGIGVGGIGMGGSEVEMHAGPHVATSDRVPAGEVEVRRGDHVDATDGRVGRVRGLVVDPGDHHVTHVLLEEGHLWGQKRIAVPISAVKHVGEVVWLNLTKDEVRDLPPVDVDHPE
jgi:sporulation protein YlmC with PRC-barrel domain